MNRYYIVLIIFGIIAISELDIPIYSKQGIIEVKWLAN